MCKYFAITPQDITSHRQTICPPPNNVRDIISILNISLDGDSPPVPYPLYPGVSVKHYFFKIHAKVQSIMYCIRI